MSKFPITEEGDYRALLDQTIACGVLFVSSCFTQSFDIRFRCSICRSAGMFLPAPPLELINLAVSSCSACLGGKSNNIDSIR